MKNFLVALWLLAASAGMAQVDSLNMVLLGQKNYQYNLSDIWGYADSLGNEYALVGAIGAFRVVDVTNPSNPVDKINIPGARSLWRDVKSWSHYAYVCHDFQYSWSTDPNEGITIVDLDSLQNPRFKRFKPTFVVAGGIEDTLSTAHNIFIDENGVLYVFGASGATGMPLFTGGALMFDLSQDPWNPTYLGKFEQYYFHDGFARNDTLWAGAINQGFLAIVDVSNKANPIVLATQTTPNQFTHNVWLSDDGNTVFTTDEKPGAFVAAYDVSDFNNITEMDKIRTLPGTDVIPHNVFVHGDFLVVSYYTRGAYVVDSKYPDLLVEVGYYDTSPTFTGDGFHGAWGAYPYLPSGNLLISDMEEGLYILGVEYKSASRVYGVVTDSLTGNILPNAGVEFVNRGGIYTTTFDGSFKAGFASTGWDTLVVNRLGYQELRVPVNLISSEYDTVNLALLPNGFDIAEELGVTFSLFPNPSSDYFRVNLTGYNGSETIKLRVIGVDGKEYIRREYQPAEELNVSHDLSRGVYFAEVSIGQHKLMSKLVVQ